MIEHRRRLSLRAERSGPRAERDDAADPAIAVDEGESSVAVLVEESVPSAADLEDRISQIGDDRQQPRRVPRSKRKK